MEKLNNLPNSWLQVKISDCGLSVTGNTPTTKEISNYGGMLPYIKPPHLNNCIVSFSEETLSEKGASIARVLPTNSVLVSCIGNLGRVALNSVPVAFNQQINAVIPNEAILPKFLYFQAQSLAFRNQLQERATATTISIVNKSNFERVNLNLPPLNEQRRIVAKIETLFSELDNGISALKTAKEQLKVYRQAVLKHAFEGKLTAKWREENADKLETPEQLLARIQQEREARYQQQMEEWKIAIKNWEETGKEEKKPSKPKKITIFKHIESINILDTKTLNFSCIYTKLGNIIDEPTYGTSKKCDYINQGVGVLRIPNIIQGKINASDLKFAEFDENEIANLKLLEGDLLTIRSNGSVSLVGTCALITEKDTSNLFAGYLIRLRPNRCLVLPKYLLHVLSSHSLRRQIESAAKSTSGVNNINTGEIQSLTIPLCSLEEQIEIVKSLEEKLSTIDKTLQDIDDQLKKAETLRQSILKKAFSGQLVQQDPNDEPAGQLLARLKDKINC